MPSEQACNSLKVWSYNTVSYRIICSKCGRTSKDLISTACSSCGSPLEVLADRDFQRAKINKTDFSLWRYRRFFPFVEQNNIVSLGEGFTPLVKYSDKTYMKLESLNPTGSFKDRGSTVLISAIQKLVKSRKGFISEDSSGNAGASMAAYAARAGLKARVYVPETVSGPKFNQIQLYGAQVAKVAGTRSDVAEEAQKRQTGKFYVGHILHPLFRDGIRSLAYEITEQSGWKTPNRIYLPVSAGTLLLGVISGFKHLVGSRVIRSMPRIVACQTSQVSPLYHKLKNLSYSPPKKITSVADALVSVSPPLLDLMAKRLKEADGNSVMVEEKEIVEAYGELAKRGFFVEPSSAVAYAGYSKDARSGEISKNDTSVIVLTGTGLKTTFKP
jgi:threonine synthase